VESMGTVERTDERYVLQFERDFHHPVERVWAALTESSELVKWLADADIELVEGGSVTLRWLNTDLEGNSSIARGTVAELDPPRLVVYETDIHGLLRWELRETPAGCHLSFTCTTSAAAKYVTILLAGWHVHLDFLAEALDGQSVDWPNWPFDRWQAHHERYEARRSEVGV
jgi:uncharacterized protein YndB with AHSA1/START domain